MSLSPAQVQALQQHLHDVLVKRHGAGEVGVNAFAPRPAFSNEGWSGGTPNMRFSERVARAVDWDYWDGVREFMKLQEEDGHCLVDFFSATHGHMNCSAAGVGLKVAHDRGMSGMVEVFVRWWQREFHLCRLMPGSAATATAPASGPWGPGARDKAGKSFIGNNAGRTLAWNYALHAASDGKDGRLPRKAQLADKGNAGVLALTLLPTDLLDRLLEIPEKLILASELRVARRSLGNSFGDDYVAWLPNALDGGIDVANAAGVWDGKPFAQAVVDDAVNERIALCGTPVVVGVS